MKDIKNLLTILTVISLSWQLLKPIFIERLDYYVRNTKSFIELNNKIEYIYNSIRLNQKKGNYL